MARQKLLSLLYSSGFSQQQGIIEHTSLGITAVDWPVWALSDDAPQETQKAGKTLMASSEILSPSFSNPDSWDGLREFRGPTTLTSAPDRYLGDYLPCWRASCPTSICRTWLVQCILSDSGRTCLLLQTVQLSVVMLRDPTSFSCQCLNVHSGDFLGEEMKEI